MLGVAFALATFIMGWWTVPALAALWGLMTREKNHAELVAAAAAGLGWSLLLIWTTTQGPVGELASRAAGVMGISSLALVGMAIVFSMVLAWSAAVVGRAVVGGIGTSEKGGAA
jgi:hypothetical protein